MCKQKDICLPLGGDHLKSDKEKTVLWLCLPNQHYQEFSKHCSKKVIAEEMDFNVYFPEQTAVQDPYNIIQMLLSIIGLKKLHSQKGAATKGTPSIHEGRRWSWELKPSISLRDTAVGNKQN